MFDIGFAELLIIAVLGLLILGPERLPKAIRTTSLWVGRLRRSFNNIRSEIEKEVGADEIRRQLHNESILASLKETKNSMHDEFSKASKQVKEIENSIHPEASVQKTEHDDTPETPTTKKQETNNE
ncbi:Sec-independent protein translocase protein TatB [Zhongshania aliphaticivorans]|uniref:Sec-independent protein translocase protein TatB n=1 Tax=Zhongshania aliphaticivorans TaxID=1470434 RepID=A0A5S9N1P4_9GAMM|nr:Sec-independent protein translocase protein TatB [Zhongshania aliphaticivorans]CAA0082538.1 Sec-independent protein translocase protein TatB [Zhongshania aliphaticivorans]CAA0084205.1 Sec-independent protein translocase protein TatB [Zhongshania aliphaticivorans]